MTFQIIIKGKNTQHKLGKTRSEQEENLRKEWGSTMNDGQLDKLKYLERKVKEGTGQTKNFFRGQDIDSVK
jgi:hypothetical protein